MTTKAKPRPVDNEEHGYRHEIQRLEQLLTERTEWALRNDEEVQQLRSLLTAATDQIQTLSGKLEAIAPDHTGQKGTDKGLQLPTRSTSQNSWMHSIVEELAQAKKKADEMHQSMLQLEKELKERTNWARSLDKEARERTAWALASNQEVLEARKSIDDLRKTNAELQARLKTGQLEKPATGQEMQEMRSLLADHQHQTTDNMFRVAAGPGDRPGSFLHFALFVWRITWPIRFLYRVVRRIFVRKLWNPLKWPAWFRRMSKVYADHGIKGFLALTAEISDPMDQSSKSVDSGITAPGPQEEPEK
jgi:hypothetical protein